MKGARATRARLRRIGACLCLGTILGFSSTRSASEKAGVQGDSPQTWALGVTSRGPVRLGGRLPQFTLKDLDGRAWTEKDLLGKTVVALVWHTGCAFCHPVLADLQRLEESYKESTSIEILSFVLNEDDGAPTSLAREQALTFPILRAHEPFWKTPMPCTWVMDRSGLVRVEYLGYGEDWLEQIREKVKQLAR